MNVGIIGSGGREHAICSTIKNSKNVDKIYCFPGNAGTADIAINVEIDIDKFDEISWSKTKENIIILYTINLLCDCREICLKCVEYIQRFCIDSREII